MKKRAKKNVRRMLSSVLILLMCISLACPVFAADETDGSPGLYESEILSPPAPDGQDSSNGEIETTEQDVSTEGETATDSDAEEVTSQPEGDESEITEGDEQPKEDEIPTVIQEFLKAVDAVLNFGEVTDENAEEYHALYEAAMNAYEAVKAEGLETDERVVVAMAELESKGDVQPKDEETDQPEGEDSENTEDDEQTKADEVPAVIQEFLDAVDAVVNFGEVTDDDPLYKSAMDAYEAVKAEGLETDERVVAAKETLDNLVKKVEENSNVFEVSNLNEFVTAIATINKSDVGSYTISLTNDIEIVYGTSHWDIGFTKNSTVTISGNGHTITLLTDSSNTFDVQNGCVLNLENVTIQGNEQTVSTAIFKVTGGSTLNMYSGVTLKDFHAFGSTGGTAVSLQSNSTFNMYGGTISNCKSTLQPLGGAVCISNGTFNMSGGVIRNCGFTPSVYNGGYGGAVLLRSNATFNMSGNAAIENCNATMGGGVCTLSSGCSFSMSDNATITGCTADNGGAVFVNPSTTFTMGNGASITGNSAETYGGGVYAIGSANVTNVYNNTAGSAGDDILAAYSENLALSPVGTDWTLTSTGRPITNWYYDGYRETVDENGEAVSDETRWTVSEVQEECYLYEYSTPDNNVSVALKAAHGIAKKVTVTYKDADGNVIGEPENQVKGSVFTVKAALESTMDKEFDYWSGDDGNTYKPGDTVTPETDLVLTAVMKAKKSDYTVEWYDADGNSIKDAEKRNTTVGETVFVTEADKVVEGYTFDKNNANNILTAVVVEDGSTTLKLYFTKNTTGPDVPVVPDKPKDTTYKVEWYDVNGNSIKATETRSAKAGTLVSVTEADKVVEGYTFDKDNANNILTAVVAEDGSTTLKLYFTKNTTGPDVPVVPDKPKDTTYKVEWYDVNGNSIKATETRSAKAGTLVSVTEADKVVEGYTFDKDNANNILTAVVAEDGSTTLKLYFTKNTTGPDVPVVPDKPKDTTYKVEWYDVNGNSIKATETRSAKAGTLVSVTEADKVVEGYTFDKNNANNILTAVVAEDGSTTLKLYFTKKTTGPDVPVVPDKPKDTTYKVEWYDVDGNSIKATEIRSAKAGTLVSVTEADKVVEGYTFDKDNANNILTAVVAEDGSTTLKLYFTKKTTGPDVPVVPDKPKDTTYKVEWYDVDGNSIKATEIRSAKAGTLVSVTEADKVVEGYTFDKDNANNILTAVVAEDGSTTLKLYFTKNTPNVPDTPPTPSEDTTPNTPDSNIPKTGENPNYALYLMLASGLALFVLIFAKRKKDK